MTPEALPYTTADRLVYDFSSRGLVLLAPEDLGLPLEIHERIYEQEKITVREGGPVTCERILDLLQVLNAPGLVAACNQLVGANWAIVPFTHNATFASGARDQHWHKDDNGPANGRKQRHHQAVQIEMLYYPMAVRCDMGPTATIPYSQYWTFDHEENHDNFAGADHLDFNYQLSGMEREPVSGPDSKYDLEDIVQARTAHDIRMRDAVTDTGWPLVRQLEVAPLRAGSIVLYSHNTFHRGNHRRDDWRQWEHNPRFMWRFWLYRTTDPPTPPEGSVAVRDRWQGVDPLTGVDLSQAPDDATIVWRCHDHWLRTGQPPPPARDAVADKADLVAAALLATGEANEPVRIGAAYKLAAAGDAASLTQLGAALHSHRESVRRAAAYGLAAAGPAAADVLLPATVSPVKWVRKGAVFAIGDACHLTPDVLAAVVERLQEDSSVYVRAVAAGSLGCLGRRAVASGVGIELVADCLRALGACLDVEYNRPAMDRAQGRSIKFVRPTDDCDVCEGGANDYGVERFDFVRSAVRENALWSLVILCSHGSNVAGDALEPTIAALRQVIRADNNVICTGFAADALHRLTCLSRQDESARQQLCDGLDDVPLHSWESLSRGGPEALAHLTTRST